MKVILSVLLPLMLSLTDSVSAQKKYEEYYPNGIVALSGFKNANTGEPEGHWKRYAENGTIVEECDYKDGLPDGCWREYNKFGCLSAITEYQHGVREGKAIIYQDMTSATDKKDVPYVVGTYHKDRLHGMIYTYDKNGNITRRGRYNDGVLVADTTISSKGITYEKRVSEVDHTSPAGFRERMISEFRPFNASEGGESVQKMSARQPKTSSKRSASTVRQQHSVQRKRQSKTTKSQSTTSAPKVKQAQQHRRLHVNDKGVIVFD